MARPFAIDFGTSNTVIAAWDPARGEGVPVHLPDYGAGPGAGAGTGPAGEAISFVPSVIHYAGDGRRWIGNQVLENGLYDSPRTFRWMKSYIARRSPGKRRIDGSDVSHFDAGRDFLSTILLFAAEEFEAGDQPVALTLPVEAFEGYEDWLTEVAEAAGVRRFRFIDEASAAALGYGVPIQPGDVYLVFDFGGGTLDVSAVRVEEEGGAASAETAGARRCRVLGKAGADLGGASIDQWLFREVLARSRRRDDEDEVRAVSNELLVRCERAKERLSFAESAEVRLEAGATGPRGGAGTSAAARELAATFTRSEFEEILDGYDFFAEIDRTIRRALASARERGYGEDDIKSVLAVGGTSRIPAVQRTLGRIFGRERVSLSRPFDAVARGAAAFVAGVDFYDHIQHDYAIRHFNRERNDYEYFPIVRRGTPYPTREPVARLAVKASYDGQRELGLLVFEVSDDDRRGRGRSIEIEYDPAGAARLCEVAPEEAERRRRVPIGAPAFLAADPPARRGERRFELTFGIDGNKRLMVSARDLVSGAWPLRDYPMVKLV